MLKFVVLAFLCIPRMDNALASVSENSNARSLMNYDPDIEPYEDRFKPARPIFNYRKNGVKIDIRVVPAINDSIADDRFPAFPTRDLSLCVLDLSISCFRNRMARFIDAIGRLDEIKLWGSGIKLVKTRALRKNIAERRMLDNANGGIGNIDRSIEDFLDTFALRISLPRSNGRRERNEIDFMLDDSGVIEGRGKKGGGGGGGKGGGKCKKMMMMMMMMGKMKLMAWAGMMSMKGMMMAGMSLMISKAMLIMKLMSLKMGKGGGGGGAGGGGGGGQLKEIVLLTKASGGGGGGGGGGGHGGGPSDSYGAPPPSSYGPPSSGGGGYDYSGGGGGGGGGWGRSFTDRIPMSMTNDQPKIVYPSIERSNFYRNLDFDSPIEPLVNSLSENNTGNYNDTEIWNASNSTNDASLSLELNTNNHENSYDPRNDEFEALRDKTSIIEVKTDGSSSTIPPTNYAKTWRNYEPTERVLNPGMRIIAIKKSSEVGRASKELAMAG